MVLQKVVDRGAPSGNCHQSEEVEYYLEDFFVVPLHAQEYHTVRYSKYPHQYIDAHLDIQDEK
jgi:hypothetical protein